MGKRHFCHQKNYPKTLLLLFWKKGHFCHPKDTSVFKRTLLFVNLFNIEKSQSGKQNKTLLYPLRSLLFLKGHFCSYFLRKNKNTNMVIWICKDATAQNIIDISRFSLSSKVLVPLFQTICWLFCMVLRRRPKRKSMYEVFVCQNE